MNLLSALLGQTSDLNQIDVLNSTNTTTTPNFDMSIPNTPAQQEQAGVLDQAFDFEGLANDLQGLRQEQENFKQLGLLRNSRPVQPTPPQGPQGPSQAYTRMQSAIGAQPSPEEILARLRGY